jgi:hypothetical protein
LIGFSSVIVSALGEVPSPSSEVLAEGRRISGDAPPVSMVAFRATAPPTVHLIVHELRHILTHINMKYLGALATELPGHVEARGGVEPPTSRMGCVHFRSTSCEVVSVFAIT